MLTPERIKEIAAKEATAISPNNPAAARIYAGSLPRQITETLRILSSANLVVVDLAELDAALKPFADEANSESNIRLSLGPDIDHWPLGPNSLTLGDLRRAAALLAALTQEKT